MDTLGNLNRALSYIEDNLAGDIELKEAARRACCSEYHFTRMFSFLAGIPLSEYIRRRRLTLAAFEIQTRDIRVLDAAVKYGYRSADAFSRAFQSMHGLSPSAARDPGSSLKAYPRMTFQLTVQGGSAMNYRVVEKESFRIVGVGKRVPIVFHGVNPEIAALAGTLTPEKIGQLKALSNVEPHGIIQASVHFSEGRMEEKGELDHYIGVATTLPVPSSFAGLEVAASTWAVFEAVGAFPDALQNVWGRIYSEWLPSAGYEVAPGPEILWNESADYASPAFRSEIWIPVVKKRKENVEFGEFRD